MKKNSIYKIIPAVALSAALLVTNTAVFAEGTAMPISTEAVNTTAKTIAIGGAQLDNGAVKSFEEHAYVPVRAIAEALGFEVSWVQDTKTITLTSGAQYITFSTLADGYTFARTAPLMLGYAPILTEGTTYVPFEFLTDIMQLDAKLNDDFSVEIATAKADEDVAEDENVEQEAATAEVVSVEIGDDINEIVVNDSKIGEVRLNISADTVIVDAEGNPLTIEDIEEGMTVVVEYGEAMTMSLPPLNNPITITVQ